MQGSIESKLLKDAVLWKCDIELYYILPTITIIIELLSVKSVEIT